MPDGNVPRSEDGEVTRPIARAVDGAAAGPAAWLRHQATTTISKGQVMSGLIRNAGRRVGRAIRTAGRRYVEMMASCDPNGFGYYVW
jgi:hypothetical protein